MELWAGEGSTGEGVKRGDSGHVPWDSSTSCAVAAEPQSSQDAPAPPPARGTTGTPGSGSPAQCRSPGPGGHPVHGGMEGLCSGARALPITTVRARAAQAEAAPAAAGPPGWRGGGSRPPCRGTDPALAAAGGRGGDSAANGSEQLQPRGVVQCGHKPRSICQVGSCHCTPLHPQPGPPKNRAPDRAVRGSQKVLSHLRAHLAGKAPPDNGESFWQKSHQHTAPQKLPWWSYQAGVRAALMPGEQHQWGQGQRPRQRSRSDTHPLVKYPEYASSGPGREPGTDPSWGIHSGGIRARPTATG